MATELQVELPWSSSVLEYVHRARDIGAKGLLFPPRLSGVPTGNRPSKDDARPAVQALACETDT